MKLSRLILIVSILLLLNACSTTKGPAMGSPEWLWSAAREAYNAGDYEKTCDHLRKIEKQANNPFVDRAHAWRLLIEAGSANAQMELAKAYADGGKMTRTDQLGFSRAKQEHLQEAKRHAVELFEAWGDVSKKLAADKPVVLEFPFPQGSAAYVTDLDRIYKGMNMPEDLKASTDDKMLKRGLVRVVGAALATEDDAAKAQMAFKDGKAEVPAAKYVLAIAVSLHRSAAAFDRKNLNEPEKQRLFEQKAQEIVKQALELKPDADTEKAAKKLQPEIEKQLKELTKGKKA